MKTKSQSSSPVKIQPNQAEILKYAYKFRYLTANLLADVRHKNYRNTKDSLDLLVKLKYLGKRFYKSYHFEGKSARYYLMPEGLKYLRAQPGYNHLVLHAMYKNPYNREDFIGHHIDILRIYLVLLKQYPAKFDIFGPSEVKNITELANLQPSLYLRAKKGQTSYVLDVLQDKQNFILKKRIRAIVEDYEQSEGDEAKYPTILLVCPDGRREQMLGQYIQELLESTGIDTEITFLTTTLKALKYNANKEVWTNPVEPNNPVSL